MNWTGKWHNPAYSGEGIDIAEYSDGKVIAHWYSLTGEGLHSVYRIAVGERPSSGTLTTLDVWAVEGVVGNHKERPYGRIFLSDAAGGKLRADYEFADREPYERILQPLYVPASQPEPETEIVIQQQRAGRWVGIDVPVEGGGQRLPLELLLSVTEGSLTIKDTYATGPWNPVLRGIKRGEVLGKGTMRKLTFAVDAGREVQDSGTYSTCDFGVHTVELGQIIQLTAHVQKSGG